MPETSSARSFVRAIQTRSTNTTRTLERLFLKNPSGDTHPLTQSPHIDLLTQNGALSSGANGALPTWAKNDLVSAGLTAGPEIDHIDDWPADQREEVRSKMVLAIENNLSIRFSWELHDGNDEITDTGELGDDLSITFRSPKWKVRVVGPDNIVVDV